MTDCSPTCSPTAAGAGATPASSSPFEAARALALDRWADWKEDERRVVNLANIYAELDATAEPLNALQAFEAMAQLASPA